MDKGARFNQHVSLQWEDNQGSNDSMQKSEDIIEQRAQNMSGNYDGKWEENKESSREGGKTYES